MTAAIIDLATRKVRPPPAPATLFRDLDPVAQRRAFRCLQRDVAEIVAGTFVGTSYSAIPDIGGSGEGRRPPVRASSGPIAAFGRYLAGLDPDSQLRAFQAVAADVGIILDLGSTGGGGGRFVLRRRIRQRMAA
jgi:hypothetical protein